MKKVTSLFLIISLCTSLFIGCTNGDVTSSVAETKAPQEEIGMLNGKKIIFIGNSFTYYGKCVIEKSQSELGLENRVNDHGFFYEICKANGMEVSVTNFTFGSHILSDFYSGSCGLSQHEGVNHLDYLTDLEYDYVVMQNGTRSAELTKILPECEPLMKLFRDANPDVKFVFLAQHAVHKKPYNWRSSLKELESAGIIVVDWGALVYDVMTGATAVPGATQSFDQNSFIISKSASDGFHPNILTGYITALMTYCAITGDSAVGQPYNFGSESLTTGDLIVSTYKTTYYSYNNTTNFDMILKSEADMTGLQKLIDQYLADKGYRSY